MCGESRREKLHSICFEYLSDEPGMALMFMVCGTMDMEWEY